ncbi:glycosyltransferase family 2 protein [Mucilaginibacter glaciei]|uniref:Glycosyltransferase n=1 Tax=Mucilaginibacter glaciei TaxID=2772109 RepID=A0A926S1Y3_9SPHI|nr:glycosyltransferase [Mucilaginibacter glaciei]MBD1393297.1 glycosyltransferase [Mucilaginibacter glaciei]
MQQPTVSIIIPCYNSGQYLTDALNSVKTYPDQSILEVIIIDDGSSEQVTIDLLNKLKAEYTVLRQENKGPAAARNAGVKIAKSEFLLFLDSDNKIRKEYIEKGLTVLTSRLDISIIHGKPVFFGDTAEPRFDTGPFDLDKILKQNYIDTCVVMRKSTWQALNGQDEDRRIIGHEDWDFWIRAAEAGYQFKYLDEVLFEYRISASSLVKPSMQIGGNQTIMAYMYGKHALLVNRQYTRLYNLLNIYKDDQRRPLRSFIKFAYHKYFRK